MNDYTEAQGQQPGTERRPWNKGRLIGQKPPLKLKDIWAIRLRLQLAGQVRGPGALQPRRRQQAPWLRLGARPGRGHRPRRHHHVPGDGRAAEDWQARPVRADRADTGSGPGLGRSGPLGLRGPAVSGAHTWVVSPLDPAVRPDREVLGGACGSGPPRVRHPFSAPHQGDPHLPADQESPGGSAPPRAPQAGLCPAQDYVPCSLPGLIFFGSKASGLDIGFLPRRCLRPGGELHRTSVEGRRYADSHVRHRIGGASWCIREGPTGWATMSRTAHVRLL